MERILLSVEPADGCWQIVLEDAVLASEPRKRSAIDLAKCFARNRHEATGEPTGVIAPICNGEVVVLERCGALRAGVDVDDAEYAGSAPAAAV